MKRTMLGIAFSLAAISYASHTAWNYENVVPRGNEVWKQRRPAKRYKHKRSNKP